MAYQDEMCGVRPHTTVRHMDTRRNDTENIITAPPKRELDLCRKDLLGFVSRELMPRRKEFKDNGHFREWLHAPMAYWRYVELPLTLWYMSKNIRAGQTLLDIGSPKLLALYLAVSNPDTKVIASDISDYFVPDFEGFKDKFALEKMQVATLDGRSMGFEDGMIAQVFSVSVLEHIPEDGDSLCMAEIGRVLRPGGLATLTLPYTQSYCEEWLEGIKTYWSEHSVESGEKVFFQRRYAWKDIVRRIIEPSGLRLKGFVLTAERPIEKVAEHYYHGKLAENCNYINERIKKGVAIKALQGIVAPLGRSPCQWLHSYYSRRYHYFTSDKNDKRALNIALHLEKRD